MAIADLMNAEEAQWLVKHHHVSKPRSSFRSTLTLCNRLGIAYFISFITTAFMVNALFILPRYCHYDEMRLLKLQYISCFIYFQILSNFSLVCFRSRWDNVRRNRTLVSRLPTHASQPWRECPDCAQNVPPRSHHCPICRCCVLKRDHHCFFSGVCIGFHNQRYFVVMTLYAVIGGCLFLFYLRDYFSYAGADPLSLSCYRLFFPVTLALFFQGKVTLAFLLLAFYFYFVVASTIIAGLSFGQQIVFIFRGQTAFENKNNVLNYQQAFSANFESVFGQYGLILLVLPLPFVPYGGDGFTWKCKVR